MRACFSQNSATLIVAICNQNENTKIFWTSHRTVLEKFVEHRAVLFGPPSKLSSSFLISLPQSSVLGTDQLSCYTATQGRIFGRNKIMHKLDRIGPDHGKISWIPDRISCRLLLGPPRFCSPVLLLSPQCSSCFSWVIFVPQKFSSSVPLFDFLIRSFFSSYLFFSLLLILLSSSSVLLWIKQWDRPVILMLLIGASCMEQWN